MQQEFLYILATCLYLLQAIIMPATSPRRVEFCPILIVLCAKDDCGRGPEYEFVVRVTGGDSKVKPSYKWSISSGRIIDGEGTRRITVDASGSEENCLTVRAEVNGYDRAVIMKLRCLRLPYARDGRNACSCRRDNVLLKQLHGR